MQSAASLGATAKLGKGRFAIPPNRIRNSVDWRIRQPVPDTWQRVSTENTAGPLRSYYPKVMADLNMSRPSLLAAPADPSGEGIPTEARAPTP